MSDRSSEPEPGRIERVEAPLIGEAMPIGTPPAAGASR